MKRKSHILIICFLFTAGSVLGQQDKLGLMNRQLYLADSLMNAGSGDVPNTLERLTAMLRYAGAYEGMQTRIFVANSRWHVEKGNCDSALYFARKAQWTSQNNANLMRANLALGASHRCMGLPDSALSAYFSAERMAITSRDTFVLIRSYFYLGHVHSELGKFEKAASYYELSNRLAKLDHDEEFIARSILALASNLADRGMLRQALPVLQQALAQCKKAGLIRPQATACNNLGLLCKELGLYNNALGYFEQSLKIQSRLGNKYEMATEYNNMAMIRIMQNHCKEAIPLLLEAEKLSQLLPEIYHNLALCYAETGDFEKAYNYKSIHKHLDDSLGGVEMLKHTEQLREEFEAEKRQMEISTLKQENEVKELKNKVHLKQRDIFIGLAAALFFIGVLVYFILRQKVLNAKQVSAKDRRIHEQQLEEMMRNSELQSIHTMIETQEKERRRIAEDLHDRVGSMLSTIKLRFSGFVSAGDRTKQEHSEVEKLSHLIDNACEEIRMVSHNLVSGVLDTFGLIPALYDLREALTTTGIAVNITSHGMDARVPRDIEINLYRVLQELLNNTIRHAGASRVEIEITRFRDQLTIIYSDNGSGFDVSSKGAGIGLKNIQSRIDKLDGTFHTDSGKGNGSTFIFTINHL